MHSHPSTTSPTLAQAVAELFGRPRRAEIVHLPERRAPQAMMATLVALPSQMDIDEPTTTEARTALAMTAARLASLKEQWTGLPTSAKDVYNDARGLMSTYTLTYRRVATRDDNAALRAVVAEQKVD